jgi:hypothetical protein
MPMPKANLAVTFEAEDFQKVDRGVWEVECAGQVLTVEETREGYEGEGDFALSFDGERFLIVEGGFEDVCETVSAVAAVMEANNG